MNHSIVPSNTNKTYVIEIRLHVASTRGSLNSFPYLLCLCLPKLVVAQLSSQQLWSFSLPFQAWWLRNPFCGWLWCLFCYGHILGKFQAPLSTLTDTWLAYIMKRVNLVISNVFWSILFLKDFWKILTRLGYIGWVRLGWVRLGLVWPLVRFDPPSFRHWVVWRSILRSQQMNPQPLYHEAFALPLCHNRCPTSVERSTLRKNKRQRLRSKKSDRKNNKSWKKWQFLVIFWQETDRPTKCSRIKSHLNDWKLKKNLSFWSSLLFPPLSL